MDIDRTSRLQNVPIVLRSLGRRNGNPFPKHHIHHLAVGRMGRTTRHYFGSPARSRLEHLSPRNDPLWLPDVASYIETTVTSGASPTSPCRKRGIAIIWDVLCPHEEDADSKVHATKDRCQPGGEITTVLLAFQDYSPGSLERPRVSSCGSAKGAPLSAALPERAKWARPSAVHSCPPTPKTVDFRI